MTEALFSTAALPGPDDITRKSFDNGSVLLTRPNMSSPAVVIRGYLPPGSAAEKPEKYGIANFMTSMLTAGTRTHAFRELHDEIETMGASLSKEKSSMHSSMSFSKIHSLQSPRQKRRDTLSLVRYISKDSGSSFRTKIP